MTPTLIGFVPTADGPFGMLVRDGRVLASGWTDDEDALLARLRATARPSSLEPGLDEDVAAAVERYYEGDLGAIDDVPVGEPGGGFRSDAWAALRRIPAGSPLTYAQFAAAAGRPTAVRAAASACATNPAALFVPCHRVLRTDGGLGGFAWGVPVKRALLARELQV